MFIDYLAHNLQLIVSISLNIGLQSLLADDLIGATLNFNLDLEGIALEDHEFVAEVRGMLIDRDPDSHCMVLELAIHLVHIQAIIQILL